MTASSQFPAREKLEALKWRCIGPSRGGRVVAVAGDPAEPWYSISAPAPAASGRPMDGGVYLALRLGRLHRQLPRSARSPWRPPIPTSSTPAPARPRSASTSPMATASTSRPMPGAPGAMSACGQQQAHRPDLHPSAESRPRLCRGAGRRVRPEQERGVFRSSDGGKTWEKILYRSDVRWRDRSRDGSATTRASCSPRSGRPGATSGTSPAAARAAACSASTDGGDTWEEISRASRACPPACWARSASSVSPASAGRVWALVEADGRQDRPLPLRRLRRALDHGLAQPGPDAPALVLYARLRRHARPDTVYVTNLQMWKSTDGGASFTEITTPHGDNHDLWIDPEQPGPHDQGNDGGANVSFNGGAHLVDDLQPADRAVLSHRHRQPLSLPRLRHAAGQHLDRRAERDAMGRHHSGRLLLPRHRRERLHRRAIRAIPTSSMSARSAPARAAPERCSATTTAPARSSWSTSGPRNRPASRRGT